jgi:hypothetical protein
VKASSAAKAAIILRQLWRGLKPRPFKTGLQVYKNSIFPQAVTRQAALCRHFATVVGWRELRGLKSVLENSSFAPLGLDHFPLVPTAYAVGCILSPFRGWKPLPYSTLNLQSEISRTHLNRALSKKTPEKHQVENRVSPGADFKITQLPNSTITQLRSFQLVERLP